MATAGDSL